MKKIGGKRMLHKYVAKKCCRNLEANGLGDELSNIIPQVWRIWSSIWNIYNSEINIENIVKIKSEASQKCSLRLHLRSFLKFVFDISCNNLVDFINVNNHFG